jgi:hypothetical protein
MEDITIKYWSPHGRQEETKFQKSHTKIDLAMRAAKRVDLSDIRKCTHLEKLDLSHNMLDDLDLSPIAKSSFLQELRIQNNHLTSIDLWPLVDCTQLKEIDISDNRVHGLDITPVFLFARVRMDSSTVISADNLLRYIFTKEQLHDRFQLIRTDRAPWTAPPVIMWLSYRELARRFDWSKIRGRITSLLRKLSKENWFGAQRGMLSGFGMDELAGFDGDSEELLDDTENNMSYKDARHVIFDNAIKLLESQLERGGPTLFLDTDGMRKTRASKLIPLIAEKRKAEVENANILIKGSKVFLEDLWMTHYGYQILAASKLGLITDIEELTSIKGRFEELGMTIQTTNVKVNNRFQTGSISESMRSHVLNTIRDAFD